MKDVAVKCAGCDRLFFWWESHEFAECVKRAIWEREVQSFYVDAAPVGPPVAGNSRLLFQPSGAAATVAATK